MMVLGIDIGGMSIKAALCTPTGEIVRQAAIPTVAEARTDRELCAATASLLRSLLADEALALKDVLAIGAGSPGTIDKQKGRVLFAGNLPFHLSPLRRYFNEELALPFFLGNDANVAALAESRLGEGAGAESALIVTLGTGIGVGFVLRDRLYDGFNGAGVEAGHTVIQFEGEPCTCGRRGCFEAYASARALEHQIERAAAEQPDSLLAKMLREQGLAGRLVFEAREQGCPLAERVVERYIAYLGIGLANYVNTFLPERIILGGGISKQGEWFRAALEREMRRHCFSMGDLPDTELRLARLGNEAGMIGAALYAQDCLQDGLSGWELPA